MLAVLNNYYVIDGEPTLYDVQECFAKVTENIYLIINWMSPENRYFSRIMTYETVTTQTPEEFYASLFPKTEEVGATK